MSRGNGTNIFDPIQQPPEAWPPARRDDTSLCASVLIVDDDATLRGLLEKMLRRGGYEVRVAASGTEALALLSSAAVDAVISDELMPGMSGSELLARVRTLDQTIPVIIMTGFGSVESAVELVKAGAYHYLEKPFSDEHLLATVESALGERRSLEKLRELTDSAGGGRSAIVAESTSMKKAVDVVLRAADAPETPVLLLGESGTGKEILARTLHAESTHRNGPFVAVNCSAIPETLLESQLFGHRRGAFTDAREDRRGLFLEAEDGVILLDEIGDMPAALQGKLLRVLQEREVHPLGASSPVKTSARVIAATHRDLEELVEKGLFRLDLYYRLNVIAVRVPALRERPEDLLPLAAHFLERHSSRLGRPVPTLAPEAAQALRNYHWPGNVRELENAIERALVLGAEDAIRVRDLPEPVRALPRTTPSPDGLRPLAEVEREHILSALRAVNWNKSAAARLLHMDRKTLYRKLDHHSLRTPK